MKRLVKILIGLLVLLLLGLVALLWWLDPNVFKPRIQAIAEQQGVHLAMEGDLSWRFWPSIGIELNQVSVAALDTPDQPIARLDRASLMVATAPLFSGDLVVERLLIDGARVDVAKNAAGVGSWEALAAGGLRPPPLSLRPPARGAPRITPKATG